MDANIEKLLKDVADEEGFSDYVIEKAPGSTKGDGYIGVMTSIQISGTRKSDNEKQELNLIIKSASKNDLLRKQAPIAKVFKREIYMYEAVFPTFQHFEIQRGLPPFSSSAKCYKVCSIEKRETLIMEDLKSRGYSVCERRKPLDHEHLAFVMKEYGRFHALSYALRDQDPETFEKLTQSMNDALDSFVVKLVRNSSEKAVSESLDLEADKKAFAVFKKFIDDDLDGFFEGLRSHTEEFSVILHGDCWTNNMMFKYQDKENLTKPTGMCIIDLQLSRLGSPVLDLSCFLYSCSSKAAIGNIEEYLNIYYDSLSSYLKTLGSNPDELYSNSVFRQQWKDLAKFGLMCSTLLIHVMLSEENEAPDFADVADSEKNVTDVFNYKIANAEDYNDRVRHVILHFVENNLIS